MPARAIMFQGTGSHVGKSVLVTAFCRLLRSQGVRVAPFKAVNMSNNAWVTPSGGEIAMAQAVQARACGITPEVSMNPVLLKPMADGRCQVILLGRPLAVVQAGQMPALRAQLLDGIAVSLRQMLEEYEGLVIEGAGSPAEVNLREADLANMRIAEMARSPVVLVGDIERGGVFAQLVGTLELLELQERIRVKGFIINKFRGDRAILEPGLRWLEEKTGLPVFGVLPFLNDLRIPEEDSLGIEETVRGSTGSPRTEAGSVHPEPFDTTVRPEPFGELRGGFVEGRTVDATLRIQILRYPAISNFTDFDPLREERGVEIQYLQGPASNGPAPHLLILPGSRSTMADLAWLRRTGLDRHLRHCRQNGAEILGICGGFQMLGEAIDDPIQVESAGASTMPGLGLLPIRTLFLPTKVTAQVKGVHLASGLPVRGYEIRAGRLNGPQGANPVFRLQERAGQPVDELDGCEAGAPMVWGTYLHGLFEEPAFRRYFMNRARSRAGLSEFRGHELVRVPTDPFDELADAVAAHVAVDRILELRGNRAWTLCR